MFTPSSDLPADDRQVRALIASAKQMSAQGRAQEAERLLRQAEAQAPRHPLVLNEAAARMLYSGNPAGAVELLEQVVQSEPGNAEAWFHRAAALRMLGRPDEALTALERVLEIDPRNVSAMLEKGALEETQGNPRAAAMSYRTALQMIPPNARLAPAMERTVQRAREAVDANNRALEHYMEPALEEVKARFPGAQFARFDQCADIMLRKRGIYRQQPTFMFFPEMPAIEFYPRELFPWIDVIDAVADDIRAELLDVWSGEEVLDPYIVRDKGTPSEGLRDLTNSRRWGVYAFWNEGKTYAEHIERCPKTIEALKAAPLWDMPGNGPTAMFSILDARTRIPPHTGPVNTRLVCHLPLVVPPGCGFRVGGQTREWRPGEAFVFDDSIEHEAWNDSDQPRAVLLFDTWSLFLSEAERELVRTLTGKIGEYYGVQGTGGGA